MGRYHAWAGYMLQTELRNRGLPVTGLVETLRKTLEENDEQLARLGIDTTDPGQSRRARLVNDLRVLCQPTESEVDDELKKSTDRVKDEYGVKIKEHSKRLEKIKTQYEQTKVELDELKSEFAKEVQKLTDAGVSKRRQLKDDEQSKKRGSDILRELNSISSRVYTYEDFALSARPTILPTPTPNAPPASSNGTNQPARKNKPPRPARDREITPPERSMFMPTSPPKISSSAWKPSSNSTAIIQSQTQANDKKQPLPNLSKRFVSEGATSSNTPKATRTPGHPLGDSPTSKTGAKYGSTTPTTHSTAHSSATYSPPSSLARKSRVSPSPTAKPIKTQENSPSLKKEVRAVATTPITNQLSTTSKASSSPLSQFLDASRGTPQTPAKPTKPRTSSQPEKIAASGIITTSPPTRKCPPGNSETISEPTTKLRANAFDSGPTAGTPRTPSPMRRTVSSSSTSSSLSKKFATANLHSSRQSPTPSYRRSQSGLHSQTRPQPPDPATRYRSQTPCPRSRAASVISIPRIRKRAEYEEDK
ncbi:hypothetical protein BP6252_07071 [Coleophoma cylindrospora]|uniref:Uncharacterized protein n=1 Tax=Coleophoma cylindrospora TaxID=1849047 RepID=A0A3D8RH03_9HELO|nr:hypothetical protein BP6252_07071 [Coleophoma cylindrospora]